MSLSIWASHFLSVVSVSSSISVRAQLQQMTGSRSPQSTESPVNCGCADLAGGGVDPHLCCCAVVGRW